VSEAPQGPIVAVLREEGDPRRFQMSVTVLSADTTIWQCWYRPSEHNAPRWDRIVAQ
jgi:hypothetical protein